MRWFWYLVYIGIQVTWGLIQTILGGVVFLVHLRSRHAFYRGSILTEWTKTSGLSLGLFIFVPHESDGKGRNLISHEYGHTLQSLMLGPLYLIIVGLPSYIWANSKIFKGMRLEKGVHYSRFWIENWADRLGSWHQS